MVLIEPTADQVYSVDVRDETGKVIERTERGEWLRDSGVVSPARSLYLEPGESAPATEVDLSKLFRFQTPGAYTVSVSRRIYTDMKVVEYARSELLTFTIRP